MLARISAQTTFEGATRYVFGELPKDKVDALQAEMTKLIGQVTIGLALGALALVLCLVWSPVRRLRPGTNSSLSPFTA